MRAWAAADEMYVLQFLYICSVVWTRGALLNTLFDPFGEIQQFHACLEPHTDFAIRVGLVDAVLLLAKCEIGTEPNNKMHWMFLHESRRVYQKAQFLSCNRLSGELALQFWVNQALITRKLHRGVRFHDTLNISKMQATTTSDITEVVVPRRTVVIQRLKGAKGLEIFTAYYLWYKEYMQARMLENWLEAPEKFFEEAAGKVFGLAL